MPIIIDEIVAEELPPVSADSEPEPNETQSPASDREREVADALTLIRERQQRLVVD